MTTPDVPTMRAITEAIWPSRMWAQSPAEIARCHTALAIRQSADRIEAAQRESAATVDRRMDKCDAHDFRQSRRHLLTPDGWCEVCKKFITNTPRSPATAGGGAGDGVNSSQLAGSNAAQNSGDKEVPEPSPESPPGPLDDDSLYVRQRRELLSDESQRANRQPLGVYIEPAPASPPSEGLSAEWRASRAKFEGHIGYAWLGDKMADAITALCAERESDKACIADYQRANENANAALRAAEEKLREAKVEGAKAISADTIRAQGWLVAVHNDYRLNGEPHTFWLFTKDGQAVKGEGHTDAEALTKVSDAIAATAGEGRCDGR